MTSARTRVLVLYGGRSSEHEVSCLSAANVVEAIDPERFEVILVGITPDGRWTLTDSVPRRSGSGLPRVPADGPTVALVNGRDGARLLHVPEADETGPPDDALGRVDVCWPVLHGSYGEDGTIQGLLATFGLPYVGPDVASSAIAIDKLQMKRVFASVGLPQVPYVAVARTDWDADAGSTIAGVEAELAYPVFTKPARQGSSVGISRCQDRAAMADGIRTALKYDRVVLVEAAVADLREIECGVIGNDVPRVTDPGETVYTGAFYDFEAKYTTPVELRCPADIPEALLAGARSYAERAYRAIGARGLARVDLFYVDGHDDLLVNEINTLPGMTDQSMFWAVWEAEGVARAELATCVLTLALATDAAEENFPP